MAYSDKVLDHYNNPRNVGSLRQERSERRHRHGRRAGVRRRDEAADQGQSGHRHHRRRQVQDLRLRQRHRQLVARHRMAARARPSTKRWQIKNTEIVNELSLPPVKIHCSVLAEDAIKAAIDDYKKKQAVRGRQAARRWRDGDDEPGAAWDDLLHRSSWSDHDRGYRNSRPARSAR